MTDKPSQDPIREIERLLLKVALLILLLIGLIRVIAPEIRSLREFLVGASVVNTQQGARRHPADMGNIESFKVGASQVPV